MSQVKLTQNTPQRILVRGVNWLGDAIMSMPAVARLREAYPHAYIAMLTPAKLAELWTHFPAVDQVLTFTPTDGLFSIARMLRQEQFNVAVVLPNSPRSALETWLAGIPIRIGYSRPWRNLFLTVRVQPRAESYRVKKRSAREVRKLISKPGPANEQPEFTAASHQVYDYLHLMSCLGAKNELVQPMLSVPKAEKELFTKRFLEQLGPGFSENLNLAALAPGAEYGPAKRWPAQRFVAAANELNSRTGCRWLIFGSTADVHVANEIARAVPSAVNLCGRTSLTELIAGLALCRVLLSNDSGAAHVGAAVGTPVVVPFGSTEPALTGPGLPGDKKNRFLRASVLCAPCFRRTCPIDYQCMKSITVEQIVDAVMAVGFAR